MRTKNRLKNLINRLPYVRELYKQNVNFKKNSCFPAGHFYSPIVSVDDIHKRAHTIWQRENYDGIEGINLREDEQIGLLADLSKYYSDLPFDPDNQDSTRYYYENGYYSYTDGIILYSIIRQFRPKKIIEIGSGFSSAVMLDTNSIFFKNQINLTFVEPYAERLKSLITEEDFSSTTLIEENVQNINLKMFDELNKADILFIDSTHVAKTGSDVNYILFEILPRLKSGVLIHFHDIFYPFEYPKDWVFMGRNWNEAYILKAFLMYNNEFEIKIFSDYLHKHHKEAFKDMPLTYNNTGGNIWIVKK